MEWEDVEEIPPRVKQVLTQRRRERAAQEIAWEREDRVEWDVAKTRWAKEARLREKSSEF